MSIFLPSCRRQRGVMESISGWVFGQRLDGHTPSELQAEVFHAEANLLLSFLTFLGVRSIPLLSNSIPPCSIPFHSRMKA